MLRRFLSALVCSFLLVLFAGCGGGGGGGSAAGSLSYTTDWSHVIAGNGDSQLVTLYNNDGVLLQQKVINRTSGASTSFSGLSTSQTYKVVATLYSGADATGTALGNVTQIFSNPVVASMTTEAGSTVASVRVNPSSATISAEYSKQFTTQAIALSGIPTFALDTDFSWSAIGTVATVDSSGLALGTSAGSGAIKATYTPTGASGSAGLTVTAFSPKRTKWTVLVYMAAVNNLDQWSVLNFNQMENVANNDLRFVVQWSLSSSNPKGTPGFTPAFNSTRRYEVQPDSNMSVLNSTLVRDLGDVDSGRPGTLKQFLDWAVPLYPSDHYCLVVWDHGSGWADPTRAFAEDDVKGTWIQSWELSQALQGHHFDILAWDCSLQQMVEMAYEAKDYADYVAGSEESPPGRGYPYDQVFAKFASTPDDTPRNLSKGFVDGMINNYQNTGKITQSVIDTSKLPALATAVNALSTDLIANQANLQVAVPATRSIIQGYNNTATRYYQDLRDYVQTLKVQSGVPSSTIAACNAVDTAAADAIVWQGHNIFSARSTGISIDNSPGSVFSSLSTDYAKMKWAAASKWGNWLLIGP